jgi:alcohol dehydrogenase class IV
MSSFIYLTQIHIEFGALKFLADECQKHGITKPLIVTDAGIKAAGLLQKALDALPGCHCTVFDATPSNPTEAAVRAATALSQSAGCNGLIALGGGSSIDCAKGVAIAATHPGPLTTYATIEGGSGRITDKVLPLIAVPTTAGTGTGITPWETRTVPVPSGRGPATTRVTPSMWRARHEPTMSTMESTPATS